MHNIWDEFKKFAVRGSVIDLAVGVIIGAAFNKIVSSLVDDIIMPPLGLLLGKVDFTNMYMTLRGGEYESLAAAKAAGALTWNYGLFLNNVVGFVLTAFAIFLMVRFINRLRAKEDEKAAAAPATKPCPFCVSNIAVAAVRCPACTSDLAKTGN